MSHFTVMVFGENVEEQLAPYQENNMGDCPSEYLRYCYYDEGNKLWFDNEQQAKKAMGNKFDKEEGWYENPNKKWDWYQIGGRWADFFKLKENATSGEKGERSWYNKDEEIKIGYADSALKKDIDFESMMNKSAEDAAKIWDKAAKLYPSMNWEAWDSVRNRFKNIDEARDFYHSQEAIKAFAAYREEFGFFFSFDELLIGREAYIENAKSSSFRTYAFIKDGKWYGKGNMGWRGVSLDEDENAYNKAFLEAIENATPDTRITIVDCHI